MKEEIEVYVEYKTVIVGSGSSKKTKEIKVQRE